MSKTVDSYRFVTGITKRMVKKWIDLEQPREIPWMPLSKSLEDCTVAMVSTGGLALKTDKPFDQDGERDNPWWGDPTYRIIPRDTKTDEIKVYHLHINPEFGELDINCLLPLDRLDSLVEKGEIGSSAPSHYSIMGYIMKPDLLVEETAPAMIAQMKDEKVDVVLLVPA